MKYIKLFETTSDYNAFKQSDDFIAPNVSLIDNDDEVNYNPLIMINPSVSMNSWTYGETASNPVVSGNTGNGIVTYMYKVSSADDSTYTTTKPSDVGTYTIKATIEAKRQYSAGICTTTFTISKASINPSVSMSDWTYGETASDPVVSGNIGNAPVTYMYKVSTADDNTYILTKPSDAGTYIIQATIEASEQYSDGICTTTFTINKITPTVVSPVPNVLTFNKSTQELATIGSTDFGTLKYSLDNSSWSTNMPTATNGGTYILYYKVDGDGNINNVAANSITCSIAEKRVSSPTIILSQELYTYNGSSCTPNPTVKDGNDVIDPIEYTVSYLNNINAGTASVVISDIVDGNYYIEGIQTFTISKANINPSVSMSDWTYGETASNPAITGNTDNGSVTYTYSSDNSTWSSTQPTNVGSYYIKATIDATTNYNGAECTNTFTISKASINPSVSMNDWNEGETASDPVISGNSGNGNVTYMYKVSTENDSTYTSNKPSDAGTYTVKATIDATTNYNGGVCTSTFTINSLELIVKYNVTSTSSATQLYDNDYPLSLISMKIDNVEVTPTASYTFSTTGEHTVKYELTDPTSIGTYVFSDCSNLTSVMIPNSVTSIGHQAFEHCSGLTSIIIPNSVITIYQKAFAYCSSLTSVTIPDSVTSIGQNAFYGCNSLPIIDNIRYADTYLVEATDKTLSTYTIKSGTKYIGDIAFYGCSSLTSITIPDSIILIGNSAFTNCTSLTSINIPSSITSIGDDVFSGCSSLPVINNIRYADIYLVGPTNRSLSTYTIKSGTKYIGNYAFRECSGLTSITIPNSVTSIGDHAFYRCSKLNSVTIPNSVTSIGNYTFSSCSKLSSITIPNSVTSIGNYAFWYCSILNTINIGSGVTSIGNDVFTECPYLVSITVDSNNTTYDSRDSCKAIIETVTNTLIYGGRSTIIPDSVTSIGNGAFKDRSQLSSIDIPSSITTIGKEAFSNCSKLTSITIPNSVTSIGYNAFYSCSGLTRVTIGNLVTSIDSSAFYNCSGLTNVTIGNSVTSIGKEAFRKCTSLTSIIIPNSVTSINDMAFYECSGLTSVTIGNSVTSIGKSAFYRCSKINSVNIPNSVTSIGQGAFQSCSGLTSVTIGNSVISIDGSAFSGCSGLTSVTIGNSVTSISDYAFSYCSGLTSITCNATTAPTIQNNTFRDINSGGTLTVPAGSTGYDVWMGTGNYYLGKYNWTKVEQ